MHHLSQRFCRQDFLHQMAWQLKWFSTMHSLTCGSWGTWHTLPRGKRSLTHVGWVHDLKWHLITKRPPKIAAVSSDAIACVQQSTERWMAFCFWFCQDVRFWMVCLKFQFHTPTMQRCCMKLLYWWSRAWQLKRHSTIRGRPNIAAIGFGTFEWIRQSPWMQIHLICCDIWHTLPIERRSLSHVIWDIEHVLPIGKHSLTRDEVTLPPVGRHCTSHLYWICMHQSTERWVEFQGFLKYQRTVASPMWCSMLCLASWLVLLKLRAQIQTMRRHGMKLSVFKIHGLLPQEIEPNMTIHQMGR